MKDTFFTRDYYTPKSYSEIAKCEEFGAVVSASTDGLIVIGFSGKRQKPDFHIRFKTKERANQFVAEWFEKLADCAQMKKQRKEERKNVPNSFKVGDVLRCMWGYDQTNVDYYEVTALIGKHTIEIRQIASISEGVYCGESVPKTGAFIDEPMRKRVTQDGCVKINSFSYAWKMNPIEVGGVKVFNPDSWTAYA
jgi:hypothetical protein